MLGPSNIDGEGYEKRLRLIAKRPSCKSHSRQIQLVVVNCFQAVFFSIEIQSRDVIGKPHAKHLDGSFLERPKTHTRLGPLHPGEMAQRLPLVGRKEFFHLRIVGRAAGAFDVDTHGMSARHRNH